MCMDLRYCRTKGATIGMWIGIALVIILLCGIVIGVCVHSHRNKQNQDDMLAAKLQLEEEIKGIKREEHAPVTTEEVNYLEHDSNRSGRGSVVNYLTES